MEREREREEGKGMYGVPDYLAKSNFCDRGIKYPLAGKGIQVHCQNIVHCACAAYGNQYIVHPIERERERERGWLTRAKIISQLETWLQLLRVYNIYYR